MICAPAVGDVVALDDRGAWGVVTDVIEDDGGEPASLVVREAADRWHAVPVDALVRRLSH